MERLNTAKNNEAKEGKEPFFLGQVEVDLGDWDQVFSACLGKVVATQHACSDLVIQDQNWQVDMTKGVISFGTDEYPLQFIGSESTISDTWLWGWDNINHYPDKVIALANQTKAFGEKWGLEALTIAQFDLDDTFNGHTLAIITCGLLDQYCYYKGLHANGAILVAFSGMTEDVFAPLGATDFIFYTNHCIMQFEVDHKIFIESFLLWNKTDYEWKENKIIAHFEEDLFIEFEQAGEAFRISSLNTIL